MNPYTDKATVENYLNADIDEVLDAQLEEWIDAMSRYADTYCSQTLVSEDETSKKYDGNGRSTLIIDDVLEISAVTVDGTAVTPVQYPSNRARKNQLTLASGTFPRGLQNIEVTGIHARFAELPNDLKYAVTVLVAGILLDVENPNKSAAVKSEKVGEYQVTYMDEKQRADYNKAMEILTGYRPVII